MRSAVSTITCPTDVIKMSQKADGINREDTLWSRFMLLESQKMVVTHKGQIIFQAFSMDTMS